MSDELLPHLAPTRQRHHTRLGDVDRLKLKYLLKAFHRRARLYHCTLSNFANLLATMRTLFASDHPRPPPETDRIMAVPTRAVVFRFAVLQTFFVDIGGRSISAFTLG